MILWQNNVISACLALPALQLVIFFSSTQTSSIIVILGRPPRVGKSFVSQQALILFVCFAKEAHFCSFRDGNAFCLFVIAKEQNRTSAKPSTKSRWRKSRSKSWSRRKRTGWKRSSTTSPCASLTTWDSAAWTWTGTCFLPGCGSATKRFTGRAAPSCLELMRGADFSPPSPPCALFFAANGTNNPGRVCLRSSVLAPTSTLGTFSAQVCRCKKHYCAILLATRSAFFKWTLQLSANECQCREPDTTGKTMTKRLLRCQFSVTTCFLAAPCYQN